MAQPYSLNQVLSKFCSEETRKTRREILLGFVADKVAERNDSVTVRQFIEDIWPRITASECDIYFDQILRPIGCLSWVTRADPRPVANGKGRAKRKKPRHGTSLLLVGFIFTTGSIGAMLKGVRSHLLSKTVPLCYGRQKAGRQWEARIRATPGIRSVPTKPGAAGGSVGTVETHFLEENETRFCRWAAMGDALIALNLSAAHQDLALASAMSTVTTASGMGQMRLYKNAAGAPRGLLSWAWLSDWTKDRLMADGQAPMHQCEWSEGSTLCFRDIAASADSAPQIAQDLAGGLFPQELSCLLWVRDRSSKDVVLLPIAESERASLGDWVMSQFKPACSK